MWDLVGDWGLGDFAGVDLLSRNRVLIEKDDGLSGGAQTEMYNELNRYLPDDSKVVKMLYKPAAQGLFGTVIRRAKMMGFTKKYFRTMFNKAKQIR